MIYVMWGLDSARRGLAKDATGFPLVYATRQAAREAKSKDERVVKLSIDVRVRPA